MRRIVALMSAVIVVLLFAVPASAKTGPGNSWTQMDNHNWPNSTSNPNCSPCVRWTTNGNGGYFTGSWRYWMSGDAFFYNNAVASMADWSGQMYRSPVFNESSSVSCGAASICVSARSMGSGVCGVAIPYYNSSNLITHFEVDLNTNHSYTDGPGNSGCNVRNTFRHEIGHAFSEGHSAVTSDLMYKANNNTEKVDADAQAELRAVYGDLSGGGSSGGCNASMDATTMCPSTTLLKVKLLEVAKSLSKTVTLRVGKVSTPAAS